MLDTETLHFKIGLAGTYWNKRPAYSILVNDKMLVSGQVKVDSGELFYIEFDCDLDEGPASLKIRLENKDDSDVVKDDDTKEDFIIVKDLLLHIRSIVIDEIDLGQLIFSKSTFTGNDPARPILDSCIDLGWNGTYEIKFFSPFYIWLLENI